MSSLMISKEGQGAERRTSLRQIWKDNSVFLIIVGILVIYHGAQALIRLFEPTFPIWAN